MIQDLHLPAAVAALLFMGLGAAQGSAETMAIGFLITGLTGVRQMLELVRNWRDNWSLCDLHGSALLIWYGLGAAIGLTLADLRELALIDGRDYETLLLTGVFFLLCTLAIRAAAPWERRLWRPVIDDLLRTPPTIPPLLAIFLAILWIVLVHLLLEGRIDFRSFGSAPGERLPILEVAVFQITLALTGYFGWVLGREGAVSRRQVVVLALLFIPLILLLLVGQGRQMLATHTATFFLLFAWSRGREIRWRPLIGFAALATIILVVGALLFEAQRMEFGTRAYQHQGNLITRVDRAAGYLEEDLDSVLEWQANNIPVRIFLISYLKELFSSPVEPLFGMGRETTAQLIAGVPSFLLPEKDQLILQLGGIAEMRNPDFGLPDMVDDPNSLLSAAYKDFGWLGIPYAGLAVLLIGSLLAILARLIHNEIFRVILLSSMLTKFLAVEMMFFVGTATLFRLLALLAVVTVLLNIGPALRDAARAHPRPVGGGRTRITP